MSYFKPDGTLDRPALRKRVTQIIQPFWDQHLKPFVKSGPWASNPNVTGDHVTSGGRDVAVRPTPSGLVHVMPIETLVAIVCHVDLHGDAGDTNAGWLYGLMVTLGKDGNWKAHKPLSYYDDATAERHAHDRIVNDQRFRNLQAPGVTSGTADNADINNGKTEKTTMTTMVQADAGVAKILDAQMVGLGLVPYTKMVEELNERQAAVAKLQEELKAASGRGGGLKVEIGANVTVAQGAGLPALKEITMRRAKDVFGISGAGGKAFDFDVPVFVWDGVHRDVPLVDADYQFRPELLMALLRSLVFNKPVWLNGHTGTGKSTAIIQIAARLGWPVKVLNLDSEISRMELMGRDGIVQVNGATQTQFIEGILPQALQGPYILVMDEIDFGRPDVMYAIQRVLEGNGLTLAEDAGRHVAPHPMFRMVATANTKGQGDDSGLYQGARIQSMAFLDRFQIWETVTYMTAKQLDALLRAKVKDLGDKERAQVVQYVQEHQVAFTQREVLTPISPRGAVSLAEAIVVHQSLMGNAALAIEWSVKQTVLNRAPDQDAAVLKGIADRCFK